MFLFGKNRKNQVCAYDVKDVNTDYRFWFNRLTNICLNMFEWHNLPNNLDGREIELNLILKGYAVLFVKNHKFHCTSDTYLYGENENYDFDKFGYANIVLGSQSNIELNGATNEIIYNCKLHSNIFGVPVDGGLMDYIGHYARLLADVSSTIDNSLVNNRATSFPVAKNDRVKDSIDLFFKKLVKGEYGIISDDSVLEFFQNVPRINGGNRNDLDSLIDTKERIIELFFKGIGVQYRVVKRAIMTENEIDSDSQYLLVSVDDMLKERENSVKRFNEKFNLNVSVTKNPVFEYKGGDDSETEKVQNL